MEAVDAKVPDLIGIGSATSKIPPDVQRGMDGTPCRRPKVTGRQYATTEHVCAWLGSAVGQAFRACRER